MMQRHIPAIVFTAASMALMIFTGLCSDGVIGCRAYGLIAMPCLLISWLTYRWWELTDKHQNEQTERRRSA